MENNQEKKCMFCKSDIKWCFCRKVIIIFLGAFILMISFGLMIMHGVKSYVNIANPKSVTISGHGEILAVPDIATLSFVVRSSNNSNDQMILKDQIASSTNYILSSLKNLGILENDIKTTDYTANPKYGSQNCINLSIPCQSTIVGYEASESVNIKIRNTDNINKVLDVLAKAKISEISGPNFEVDNIDKIKIEARNKAIDDAKEKAISLSKALGVKIKNIISYSDDMDNSNYPVAYKAMDSKVIGMAASAPSPETNLSKGENKINSNVSIIFEIDN